MQPLDPQVHYGITDRDFLDVHDVQMDLLPGTLSSNILKVGQHEGAELFYGLPVAGWAHEANP